MVPKTKLSDCFPQSSMAALGRQPPDQTPKRLAAGDIHPALVCQVAYLMPYQPFPSLPHK